MAIIRSTVSFPGKGNRSGTKQERNLSRFSSLVVREMRGGELPAVWIPGKQRQGEKRKKKKMSLSTTQRFPPFDLCSPPPTSNSPRRLFLFSPPPFAFHANLEALKHSLPPSKRTNFPSFPGRRGGSKTREGTRWNKRGKGSREVWRSGIAIGRKRKRWKGAPIDMFFDKTGNDELFNGVIATVSRLRIIVIRDSPREEEKFKFSRGWFLHLPFVFPTARLMIAV